MNQDTQSNLLTGRREFLMGLGGAAIGAALPGKTHAWKLSSDPLRIALIGCGSRGAGAALNALSAKGNAVLVAMADVFKDKLDETYATLSKVGKIKDFIKVPENQKFVGFDAYEKAIACADVVLLVTPAAFRPAHFEAAVKAGKHVFMEKPLASDAPGIRQILETGKEASRKNLKVVVGLQNRYDPSYQEMVKKLQEGAIGKIISATDYYLIGQIKTIPREASGQTELEFQMRNWRYFNWLWAGSPAGLQIHNTDIVNWVKNGYPVRAQGMGGRSSLKGRDHGDIFDHFYIEYEYADGTKLNSQIRHIAGTWNKGGATFQGATGSASLQTGITGFNGETIWRKSNKSDNAYQIEHDVMFAAIRNDTPLNDTEWGAKSTMTTIMGRMAAHSGKMVEWDEALNSTLSLMPEKFAWDAEPPVKPDKDGNYPVPIPGLSPVV